MTAAEPVTAGLIPALVGYYRRLEDDPHADVAPVGFSLEKVHAQIVLEADGTLAGFNDVRERTAKGKATFTMLRVPDGGGRSGTGLKPFFCWDKTGYALGADGSTKPDRLQEMFEAFVALHHELRPRVGDDVGYDALCQFLDRWDPADAAGLDGWDELVGGNVVFKLRGQAAHVHDGSAVRAAWRAHLAEAVDAKASGDARGRSLLDNRVADLARTHPKIGGVAGAQTTGASLVSFNEAAYESYGKTQAYNAPLAADDAHRYATALNRLLADGGRRARIGDATVTFWAPTPAAAPAEAWLADLLEGGKAEDDAKVRRVADFIDALAAGRPAEGVDPATPFYILGLSPNASRLSVRFWLPGTVGDLAAKLKRHHDDLALAGGRPQDAAPPIWALVRETAREAKDVPPQLAGQMTRAILTGGPYPQSLLAALVRRVRAEADVTHRKAQLVKACLTRNHQLEVPMALDADHPDEAYHLGRLFAALEKTQEDVAPGLNKTIKDSYFGAASSTPASVFPRLMRLHQFHLDKYDSPGRRVNREKLIGEIVGHLTAYPRHLPLEKQGLFHVAYYHQRQDFFTKRPDADQPETQTDE